MLYKDQIIVLRTIKHSDSGIVVTAYSRERGRCALYCYTGKKHSAQNRLFPLSIIDIMANMRHKSGGSGLPLIKEIEPSYPLISLRSNVVKNSIALFICELLLKSLKEEGASRELYDFLFSSIKMLDEMEEGVENFHLHFVVNYCKLSGYLPQSNYSESTPYFNFTQACFVKSYEEGFCFEEKESLLLNKFLTTSLSDIATIECNGALRNSFLQNLVNYMSYHCAQRMELKSLQVLRTIFE